MFQLVFGGGEREYILSAAAMVMELGRHKSEEL